MEASEIIEHAALGVVKGVGVDSLLWATTAYVPQLAGESPIAIPGWHPPGANTHWDDLIGIGISAGVAGYGLVHKNVNLAVEGASMVLGGWLISQFQPAAEKPWAIEAPSIVSGFDDLVKID